MEHTVDPKPAPQLMDKVLLGAGDLTSGTVTYENDFLAVRRQYLDRPCKGIQTTREQDQFVRRKSRPFRIWKLEVIRHSWRIFERPELELVVVFREKTERFDERS
jgi:hypothetical protein